MSIWRGRGLPPHALRLEGLLEGHATGGGDWLDGLRAWRAPADFPADLDVSTRGSRFSILFAPREGARGDDGSEARIAAALADLLKGAPPGSIGSVASTVRSTRTTPVASILTVYQVDATGAVRTLQQEAEPPPAPAPPTLGQRLRMRQWALALGVLAAGAFALWQVPPVRSTVQGSLGLAPPMPVLAGSDFTDYLEAEILPGPPQVLRLARLPGYPRDPAALDAAAASADGLHGMLALTALARGYIRCEWYDKSGAFLYGADIRVRELAERDRVEVALPVVPRAASLRLLY